MLEALAEAADCTLTNEGNNCGSKKVHQAALAPGMAPKPFEADKIKKEDANNLGLA